MEVGFVMSEELTYHVWVESRKDEKRAEYTSLVSIVNAEPGISLIELARRLDRDKRTVKKMVDRAQLELTTGDASDKGGRPRQVVFPR
jgi:transposase